jgi:hypothetical protein
MVAAQTWMAATAARGVPEKTRGIAAADTRMVAAIRVGQAANTPMVAADTRVGHAANTRVGHVANTRGGGHAAAI